jgi:hypothetical protein
VTTKISPNSDEKVTDITGHTVIARDKPDGSIKRVMFSNLFISPHSVNLVVLSDGVKDCTE